MKLERIILALVTLTAIALIYKGLSRKGSSTQSSTESMVKTETPEMVPQNAASASSNDKKNPTTQANIPGQLATVSNQNTESPLMNQYKALMPNPLAGLDRLHLLEQMEQSHSVPTEQVAMMAYYEVLNSGPTVQARATENELRRNIVSVGYGMYLDSCGDFDKCYKYAVTAFARYPDQLLENDLYSQLEEKYPEAWQQEKILAEMKKMGLSVQKKRLAK